MEPLNSYWNCQILSSLYQDLCLYLFLAHKKCLSYKLINVFVARGRLGKLFKIQRPGCFVEEETVFTPSEIHHGKGWKKYNRTYTSQQLRTRKKIKAFHWYFFCCFLCQFATNTIASRKGKEVPGEQLLVCFTHDKKLTISLDGGMSIPAWPQLSLLWARGLD